MIVSKGAQDENRRGVLAGNWASHHESCYIGVDIGVDGVPFTYKVEETGCILINLNWIKRFLRAWDMDFYIAYKSGGCAFRP